MNDYTGLVFGIVVSRWECRVKYLLHTTHIRRAVYPDRIIHALHLRQRFSRVRGLQSRARYNLLITPRRGRKNFISTNPLILLYSREMILLRIQRYCVHRRVNRWETEQRISNRYQQLNDARYTFPFLSCQNLKHDVLPLARAALIDCVILILHAS